MKYINIARIFLSAGLGLIVSGCASNSTMPSSGNSLSPAPSSAEIEERKTKYLSGVRSVEPRVSSTCARPTAGVSLDQSQWLKRLATCVSQESWAKVSELADAMAQTDMNSPWPSYFRSVSALQAGDLRRSLWMIEQAIAKVGANEIMQYQKMRVLVRLGDSAAALKEAESLLKSGSRLAPVALFVAQTRDQMGQGTIALAAYESVLEVEPSNRSALLRAGDLSWAAGAKAAAVVHYEQLISLPSEKASPRESRADLRVAEHFEGQGTDGLLRAIRTLQKLSSDAQRGLVREIAISELQQRIKALEDRVQSQAIPKQASGLRQDAGVRQ